MSTTTVMDALDPYIREELPRLSMESLPGIDPIYSQQIRTSQNVQRDRIGRQWEIMHRFETSISGQYEPRAATLGTPYTTATTSLFHNTQIGFPDAAETPHVSTVTRILGMNCHKGNFNIPTDLLKPAALNSSEFDGILLDLAGLAKLRAQLEAVSFYSPSAGYLGILPLGGGTESNSDYSMTFTPTSTRIRWWKNGMMVDVFDLAAATQKVNENATATDIPLVVDAVDYLAGTVKLTNWNAAFKIGGGENNCLGGADLDAQAGYIFPRGVVQGGADTGSSGTLYQTGHYGLEDWLIASGTLFGDAYAWNQAGNDKTAAFTIANYPQFKSQVTADLGAPLTELILNREMTNFIDAYGATIDTIITTAKVIQKYSEQSTLGPNRFNYDRGGSVLNLAGGRTTVTYDFEGRSINVLVSPYCQAGTLYGLKLGEGNLKRYVPPRAQGIGGVGSPGTGMDMGEEIEFLIPQGGGDSIFRILSDGSGNAIAMVEAPFSQYSQVAPLDVRGIKIAGITEST